ncbi:MAG: C2H2-type zinc finger protein [Actinomycetota bacterium]
MAIRCPVCGQVLQTDEQIENHDHELVEALEHAGPGFECPICHEEYDTADHLVEHEALHTTDA